MTKTICGLFCACFLLLSTSSCQSQKPGEFSSLRASKYNFVELPAPQAWKLAFEAMKQKGEIIADDGATLTMTVKFFEREAQVTFVRMTSRSCKYIVTARNSVELPAEITVTNVYNELQRAFRTAGSN